MGGSAEHWKWSSLGAVGFVATTLRGVAPVLVPAKRNYSRLWQVRDRIVSSDSSLPDWLFADDRLLWRGTPAPRDAAWWERVNEPLSGGDLQ